MAALPLQWTFQPKAMTKTGYPPVYGMGLIWIQEEMFSHFSAFVPPDSNEDMVPHPLHLMQQMYNGCKGRFSAQVRMWGPPERTAQLLLPYTHLPEMGFLALGIFCSLHSICVIPTQTSLPYTLVHSLGSFTLKKNTKQRLLSLFYNVYL